MPIEIRVILGINIKLCGLFRGTEVQLLRSGRLVMLIKLAICKNSRPVVY